MRLPIRRRTIGLLLLAGVFVLGCVISTVDAPPRHAASRRRERSVDAAFPRAHARRLTRRVSERRVV